MIDLSSLPVPPPLPYLAVAKQSAFSMTVEAVSAFKSNRDTNSAEANGQQAKVGPLQIAHIECKAYLSGGQRVVVTRDKK